MSKASGGACSFQSQFGFEYYRAFIYVTAHSSQLAARSTVPGSIKRDRRILWLFRIETRRRVLSHPPNTHFLYSLPRYGSSDCISTAHGNEQKTRSIDFRAMAYHCGDGCGTSDTASSFVAKLKLTAVQQQRLVITRSDFRFLFHFRRRLRLCRDDSEMHEPAKVTTSNRDRTFYRQWYCYSQYDRTSTAAI